MNRFQKQRHPISTRWIRKYHRTLNNSRLFTDIFNGNSQFKFKCPDKSEQQSFHPVKERNGEEGGNNISSALEYIPEKERKREGVHTRQERNDNQCKHEDHRGKSAYVPISQVWMQQLLVSIPIFQVFNK